MNTHNGTQSPNAVLQSARWETAVNHKMLSLKSFYLFQGIRIKSYILDSVWFRHFRLVKLGGV